MMILQMECRELDVVCRAWFLNVNRSAGVALYIASNNDLTVQRISNPV